MIPVSEKLACNLQNSIALRGDIGHACNCIGPQNGQPCCPCQMRGVQVKDGRYVRIQDLGPAPCKVAL
jgi:hypothetical protein